MENLYLVFFINQIEKIEALDRATKAKNLTKETKVLTIGRLAKMLVDLFGSNEIFKAIGKRNGQEIEIYFMALDEYLTFVLTTERENFDCYADRAKNPVSKVIIAVKEDKILPIFSAIVRSKNNLFGLLKLMKYIIPGKIRIKGSYISTLKWVRCIMIGKHNIYKNDK
ncbi:MAG: hypothetical protein ACFFB9_16060 [Promethearchaeota archaeon]